MVKVNPSDKQLFASIGRIFLTNADDQKKVLIAMDIYSADYSTQSDKVDDLYGKAEKNLKKALEIDPKFADAAYDLGVLYLGQGETMKERVRILDYDDPNREALEKKSEELYAQAAIPLEVYVEQDPNNSAVLRVLYQVYYNAGNTEKALEYKKRSEAVSE